LNVFIGVASLNMGITALLAVLPQRQIVYAYHLQYVMAFLSPLADLSGGFPMEMILNGVTSS